MYWREGECRSALGVAMMHAVRDELEEDRSPLPRTPPGQRPVRRPLLHAAAVTGLAQQPLHKRVVLSEQGMAGLVEPVHREDGRKDGTRARSTETFERCWRVVTSKSTQSPARSSTLCSSAPAPHPCANAAELSAAEGTFSTEPSGWGRMAQLMPSSAVQSARQAASLWLAMAPRTSRGWLGEEPCGGMT